jgi:hypothetical protein
MIDKVKDGIVANKFVICEILLLTFNFSSQHGQNESFKK